MEEDLVQILELLAAIVAAIIAYWQHHQKTWAEKRTGEVIAFFDPKDDTVTTPPAAVPSRSWKMNSETRQWVIAGHDPATQGDLLRQIDAAEGQQLPRYYLTFADRGGGFYEIEYGLMKGSGIGKPA
jgi:hypothetical protein